jgi:small subunit ribosomal protein S4
MLRPASSTLTVLVEENTFMGPYTGPKGRINRRLGALIFESAGAVRALERRPSPPGMAPPQRKLSKYGEALREKQKIKYYYGLGERQLRRYFDVARRQRGNTGDNLLVLCERRLDSVIRLGGFTKTRPQARQGVTHGHFLLNGRHANIPSISLRAGDIVHVKRRESILGLYAGLIAANEANPADWLSVDAKKLQIVVARLPTKDDITLPVDVAIVVELLSR